MSRSTKKRASTISPPRVTSIPNVITGLVDCYNFLSPNEYSEKTFGLLAFLLRKSVGEINFSDLIDEVERRNQHGQVVDFVALLKKKRDDLPEIEASIEKCLMLTRLIIYIEKNQAQFNSLISDIRIEMKMKMIDNQPSKNIQYPDDFRQREKDFMSRKQVQDIRRLFYYSHDEAKKAPNLIQLQTRTTEQLSYLIDCKMRYDPKFHEISLRELEKIFVSSFMIISHPHSGVNPVIIYERKGPGEYTAKVSVIIVSLLHDFMQSHPNLIELYDIELSLWPSSQYYKLEESQTLSWKTCRLDGCPGNKPQIIQYAELTFITIQQSSKTTTRIHFNEELHTLKFAIKLHLNLTEYKLSRTYQIPLESSPFGIASHNSHISHMLTRVILKDVQRFSQPSSTDVKIVLHFILRYFIHRTGTKPDEHLKIYIEQELTKAKNERRNFQQLEQIYMDFLVPFVQQVEFMAKHPILSMFYADGLSLGICNSTRSAALMVKSSDDQCPIVALRFNSIKIDYVPTTSTTNSTKAMKPPLCAIRVDIYNDRTKRFQYRTFDSSSLAIDISKFITTSQAENGGGHIRILSNLSDNTNVKNYKSYTDFTRYYDDRLHEIYKTNEKYKPLTNLIHNIEDDDDNRHNTEMFEMFQDNPHSVPPAPTPTFTHDQDSNSMPINEIPSNQQFNDQAVIQYVLSQPHLVTELINRLSNIQLQQQPQMNYQNQPTTISYQQQQQVVFNQPNNTNPFELNGNQTSSQDIQILQLFDDNFMQTSCPFPITEQTSSVPTNSDFYQFDTDLLLP